MKTFRNIAVVTLIVGVLVEPARLHAAPLDHWEIRGGTLPSDDLHAVTWGNGRFVAVGASAGTTLAFVSPDGIAWHGRLADGPGMLTGVAWGSDSFVAIGNMDEGCSVGCGIVLTGNSSGEVWFRRDVFPSNRLYAVTYGSGRFVAVGYDAAGLNGVSVISTNGFNWTPHNLVESGITNSGVLTGVTFGNGGFMAVSFYGPVFTSSDGVTWVQRGSALGQPRSVTYGNGLYGAAGGPATFCCAANVSTSRDGEAWSLQYAGAAHYFSSIACGNGAFVAVGDWNGALVSSFDTVNWTPSSLGQDLSLAGLAYGNATFVEVGGSTILQSGSFAPACLHGSVHPEGVMVQITGEIGRAYRLQGATNLSTSNWIDLLTFTNSFPTTNWLDTMSSKFSQRFYRVVSP